MKSVPKGSQMKRRVRFVSVLVLASALGTGCSARREQEATLRQDLRMMRQAIDKYTLEKKEAPQSLQDLVSGHYLKEIPTDPFTQKKDWVPEFSDTVLTIDQTTTGIADVHSNSTQVSSDGTPYNTW
jgi:general secretion pathway protein G